LGEKGVLKLPAAFILIIALAFPLFTAASAAGQENEDTIRVTSIMVTVNRILQDLMDVPETVNVITSEDIEREPYTSITEMLQQVPGVSADNTTGIAGAERISIRGESSGRTLIMINGVKAVDKDYDDNSVLIDLSQIERIEITKGPSSVLYGSAGIGGVINIITKKGGDKPIGFSQKLVWDSSTESLNIQSAIFGRYKGVNYRVSGSGVNAKDRRIPDSSRDGDEAAESHYRNRYYSAELGYDWNDNSISVRADKYTNIAHYALGKATSNSTRMYLNPNDRDTFQSTLVLSNLTEYLSKLTLVGSYQRFLRDVVTETVSTGNKTHVDSIQKQYAFSAQSEWSLRAHKLTAGMEYEADNVWVTNHPDYARVKQDTIGLFAQDEWAITEDFKATLGVRFSYIDGRYVDKQGPAYAPPSKDLSDTNVVGSVGLVYRGFENWALRTQWSQGYRYPSIRQLYTGSTAHGFSTPQIWPNPDLLPETSNNYEIGARYQSNDWDLDFSLFLTLAENYHQYITINGRMTYVNGNESRTSGAEASIRRIFNFGKYELSPYASGTWIKRKVTFTKGNSAGQSTSMITVPPLEGRVGLKFNANVSPRFNFYSDLYVYMASRVKGRLNEGRSVGTIGTAVTEYPAWQNVSLNLGITGGESLKYTVTLGLRNIFDQQYSYSRASASLPEAGRHMVLSVGVQY
jgi:hemoglobin/transferrin/lactoferrin receptor protein